MNVGPIHGEHVSFFVPGLPETKGSWRSLGGGRMKNDNPREHDWCSSVGWAARIAMRGRPVLDGAIATMNFHLPAPVGKKHQRDVDKLCRSILDAMTKLVYVDDENVQAIIASKEIVAGAARGGAPIGVEIHVFPMPAMLATPVRASEIVSGWIAWQAHVAATTTGQGG